MLSNLTWAQLKLLKSKDIHVNAFFQVYWYLTIDILLSSNKSKVTHANTNPVWPTPVLTCVTLLLLLFLIYVTHRSLNVIHLPTRLPWENSFAVPNPAYHMFGM